MKKLFTLFTILITLTTQAQEALYWANGSSFPYKLIEATESIVKVGEMKGERLVKRSVPKENVMAAFNARGNYMIVAKLGNDPLQTSKQIQDFYNSRGPQNDLLIQQSPVRVIECNISYISESVVNYTVQGNAGSINKSALALIIFKEGKHEFITPAADAAPVLTEVFVQVQKAIAQPARKNSEVQEKRIAATADSKVSEKSRVEIVTENTASQVSEPSAKAEPIAEATSAKAASKKGLSEDELGSYSQKGIKKVEEFVQYLNIISDKNIDPDKKDEAIDQAVKLFLADATIEVSSSNRQGKRKYPVRDYLTRLKLLPYSSTNIAWNEINYVKNLTESSDGNYYGTITGSQTFTGYGADNQEVMYSDVTQKSVKVKLQSYKKSVEGQQTTNWDILLGNVGISVNQ